MINTIEYDRNAPIIFPIRASQSHRSAVVLFHHGFLASIFLFIRKLKNRNKNIEIDCNAIYASSSCHNAPYTAVKKRISYRFNHW
jgi:hypothetical protein